MQNFTIILIHNITISKGIIIAIFFLKFLRSQGLSAVPCSYSSMGYSPFHRHRGCLFSLFSPPPPLTTSHYLHRFPLLFFMVSYSFHPIGFDIYDGFTGCPMKRDTHPLLRMLRKLPPKEQVLAKLQGRLKW